MTAVPYGDISRRAAARLAVEFGDMVPAQVEAQLHSGGPPGRVFDPATLTAVAVATLVLNVAKFAYDIYRDKKKDGASPTTETLARQIRIELPVSNDTSDEQRNIIIATVVDELLKQPPNT